MGLSSLLSCVAIGLLSLVTFNSARAQQLVGDWKAVPVPDTTSDQFHATDLPVWKVRIDGQHIIVSRWTRQDRKDRETANLPKLLEREPLMHGYPVSLQLADGGWLIGFDGGEFGGGLWATNDDGSRKLNILPDEDVHALFSTPDGVIVLSGLAHMGGDQGKAWFVPNSSWANAQVKPLYDLGSSPEASVQESTSAVLVVTDKAVSRVNSSGTLDKLIDLPYGPIVANSIVIASDRTIYVGVHNYLLRLSPHSSSYSLEWLAKTGNANISKPSSPN